jgi:hypothetical protein
MTEWGVRLHNLCHLIHSWGGRCVRVGDTGLTLHSLQPYKPLVNKCSFYLKSWKEAGLRWTQMQGQVQCSYKPLLVGLVL